MLRNLSLLNLYNTRFSKIRYRSQPIVLINGMSAIVLKPDRSVVPIPLADLHVQLDKIKFFRLLLAAPFMYSFVQHTIPLKPGELRPADNFALELSRFDKEERCVESLHLDNQRAITVFSHLSEQGRYLLEQFQKSGKRITWKPAISFVVHNLLNFPQKDLHTYQCLDLIMEKELLRVKWKPEIPEIKHCFYWNNNELAKTQSEYALNLMADEENPSFLRLSLFNDPGGIDELSDMAEKVFFPSGKENGLKRVERKFSKSGLNRLKSISPLYILSILLAGLLFWSVYKQQELNDLISVRKNLLQIAGSLHSQSDEFDKIAGNERLLIKIESLIESIEHHQLNPHKIIRQLESLFPETSWLKSIEISQSRIIFELLAFERIDISRLIETIGKAFGKVDLEENTVIQLENRLLRKYKLKIKFTESDEQSTSPDPK